MATTLTLSFVQEPVENKNIVILASAAGVGMSPIAFDFREIRQGFGQVTAPSGDTTAQIAAYFAEAWNLDYRNLGSNNSSIAIPLAEEVEITFNIASWQFLDVQGSTIDDGDITFVINNEPVEDDKSVSLVDYEAYVSDVCNYALANIAATGGNSIYDVYTYPVGTKIISAAASPFQIQVPRGISESFRVVDTLGSDIGIIPLTAPGRVIDKKINISLLNLSSGTTASISVDFISNDILPYTYSLTGSGYQSSNVFTGLAPDNYTIYVKDAFGCVRTDTFVVDGVTEITETIITISEINALRFSKIDALKKNHKNTLSCNELKRLTFPFYHRFLETDPIPTQFKTNAQYINVYAIDSEFNKTTLGHVKMTENIGLDAKSTSTYFSLGEGRSAIYFGEVDILNPLTDAVIETTDFGFTLPEWANKVGGYVTIEGIGQVPIDSIGYSDTYDSFVIEFNIAYTGVPDERKLSAIYNLQPYEAYEFVANMATLPSLFNIVIEVGSDVDNIDFTYISEKIKRVVDSDRLIEIFYSDEDNKGDMIYQTGIIHKLLLEGAMDYVGESETEGYNGDTDYFVTDNSVYDSQKLILFRLSSEMASKMRLVVSHLYLQINGLNYKIAEIPEITSNINNNLKTFSVILKRGGEQFLSASQENITVGNKAEAEKGVISGAIEASIGKSLILWTKNNG